MTAPISGIDHVVIAVRDLDRAREAYARLGFTLSPRGVHSPPLGTANHTIMAQRDYLELLGVTVPTDANLGYRDALAKGEGLVAVAVATPDATRAHAAWKAAGLDPEETIRFSRPVERPGGAPIEARFEIARLRHGLPGAEVFACGHFTREAVWLPELVEHPNTTVALRGLAIAASDPRAAAEAWERALVGSSLSPIAGGSRVTVGAQTIDLIEPRTAAERFDLPQPPQPNQAVAIELASRDLDACRAALARGEVRAPDDGRRLLVAPDVACGVAIAWSSATRA